MPFSSFGLNDRLNRAIELLNYQQPTPVQEQAIPAIFSGQDLRVTAQTGSGKTAAFLLPILHELVENPTNHHEIRALILSPTRELAKQILDNLKQLGKFTQLKFAMVTGGDSLNKQIAELRRMPDVLVATPGRLMEHIALGQPLAEVDFVVFDEADRMLDMGFAEDVSNIYQACCLQEGHRPQSLLFSATTGGPALKTMVNKVLHQPLQLVINAVQQMSENIRQQIITVDHDQHKEQVLLALLQQEEYGRALVFTNTRVTAERLYGLLQQQELKAYILHGDKEPAERKNAMRNFKQGQSRVMVATDLAARGLDLDGLDLVINFDMPRRGDEYLHRVGRTGRAGEQGLAISLIDHNSWNLMCSIERYLKQHFERRNLKDLKAKYQGPKKQKASGKAAGKKKKDSGKGKTLAKGKASSTATKPAQKPKTASRGVSAEQLTDEQRSGMVGMKRKPKIGPEL